MVVPGPSACHCRMQIYVARVGECNRREKFFEKSAWCTVHGAWYVHCVLCTIFDYRLSTMDYRLRTPPHPLPRCFDRRFDRLVVVGDREEPGFVLRGGKVEAALEHRVEESSEAARVAGGGARQI